MVRILCVVVALAVAQVASAAPAVHHQLDVRLVPDENRIEVVDVVALTGAVQPDAEGRYRFALHAALTPQVRTRGWKLSRSDEPVEPAFFGINATSDTVEQEVPLQGWELVAGRRAASAVEIRYEGVIYHPLQTQGEEYQRSFSETPGTVEEQGVFLAGTSYWIPTFGDGLVTFGLSVEGLPVGWEVISQGEREAADGAVRWTCGDPTEEIYLVGGPLQATCEMAGNVEICAFLRAEDPALANRYLAATRRYLTMYASILPPYPYASFSLVENFWETGYGMPGFTLLGPKVIRFPWILTSSYPHELLHNWWGNSVYVDVDRGGNWCEGLTAYMADHLLAEQRAEGALHRRAILQKYTDFALGTPDMPIAEFRSRTSAATEAVGYGKSAMMFHMIRRQVGDEAFTAALSTFYRDHAFRRAAFEDIGAALDGGEDGSWGEFVGTWTTRTGAPRIEIVEVKAIQLGRGGWKLTLEARQAQPGPPYPMTLPIALTVEGQAEPVWVEVEPEDGNYRAEVTCPGQPSRLDVDPAFDLMRQLDPREVPPALSRLFGHDDPLFVLPSSASSEEAEAWRALAEAWAAPDTTRVVTDADAGDPFAQGGVWLLGWDNAHAASLSLRLLDHGLELAGDGVRVGGESFHRADRSVVAVARADHPAHAVGWIAADPVEAIAGLARKLPHYSRYSFLAFRGDEPENVAKLMWDPVGSPMTVRLVDGAIPPLALPDRAALAAKPPLFDAAALQAAVETLAAPGMEGRGLGTPGLAAATGWVEGQLTAAGVEPAGDDGYRQTWSFAGGEPEREMELVNLVARVPGADPDLADAPVLVMAHLDHLGLGWPDVRTGNEGRVHPGADDNASGVAVLLALARSLAAEPARPRPVLLAVTTGEEAGAVGARHLLGTVAPSSCVNLDSVGRLGDGSLLVLDAHSAREWRFIFMGVGYTTGADLAIATEPLDSSDQAACLEAGIPAVQLTTGPHADYHRPSDTPGKLDAAGLAVVAEAAREAIGYLAERVEPLTVTLESGGHPGGQPGGQPGGHPGGGERRASLGTMPDFAFGGPGVRVQAVTPGSSAEAAGIVAGDVIVGVGPREVGGLKELSAALKAYEPGDTVTVRLVRGGEERSVDATLGER